MSAIQSLLRVMTLRDAEAIILEAGKVPSLRRRGQVEQMAMPPIEGKLLADFAEPLTAGRPASDWPSSIPFTDTDGATYSVTVERGAAGLRMVVRRAKAPPPPAPPPASPPAPPATTAGADPKPQAWWAKSRAADPGRVPAPAPAAAAAGANGDAMARLAALLHPPIAIAKDRGASDVIVSTGQPVRMRTGGYLEQLELAVDDAELAACVAQLGSSTDHSAEIDGTRVRINVFDHLGGFGVAARLIRDTVPTLAELALPPEIAPVIELREGLVLVCGPTGSGKSTTLASLVDLLDQRRAAHVITLEDPIEYRFAARRCLIHQRELGTHIPTFAAGLRAALREAPDVILLGELRDRETIAAALTAAETGHLVLATLHAPSAAGAIDRVIDAFPETAQRQVRWQLATCLRTVITQYLLPRKDGGRAPAAEVVPVTAAVANIIRKGDLHTLPTAISTGRDAGMVPLERSLARLVESGAVSPQVVKKIAADHDLLSVLTKGK
ncbi:MAG: PilT/PilU family type 4a pilus ATPase [Myxococcales bacterium]|nr:PilT/PilU family type 4a pilus ATPase [Myxococcales bacterium]